MTASSTVVLANLAYLIGAIVLAIIGGLIVWLRHRRPRSVDATMASFHRGLRALAPDPTAPPRPQGGRSVQPSTFRSVRTDRAGGAGAPGEDDAPAASEAPGERAGVEPG